MPRQKNARVANTTKGNGMKPRWTICIATVPARKDRLSRLMAVLQPQVDKYQDEIEVLIFFNNFEYSLGYLRQCLIEEAKGEYVCHIDDDDLVPEDYCDTIFPLLDGVDYIGFKVKYIDGGKQMKPVYHSLKYPIWYEDDAGYYRGVTHLNPLKTELALASGFPVEFNIGEDAEWAKHVLAKTEHFIDREMYIYEHEGDDSVAYSHYPDDTPIRPVYKSKNIRFHPKSTKETNGNNEVPSL
jgi:glycosyltransferase involved in cell wall biosynthesis